MVRYIGIFISGYISSASSVRVLVSLRKVMLEVGLSTPGVEHQLFVCLQADL